jgi:transcriptional regulator with XRE-family HTH domain
MSQLRQQFAKRLKSLRRQKGITQEDLAKHSGLSTSFIRSLEQGKYAPSFESLESIARALEISVKELFVFD